MNEHDAQIRRLLLADLRASHPDDLLVQELSIPGGIADLAVIGRDTIAGFEIKSAADSVTRLRRQVPAYDRVFDFSTLVTAENHLRHAQATLPPWWGILVAEDGILRPVRPAVQNPDATPIELLWAIEAEKLGRAAGLYRRAIEARISKIMDWKWLADRKWSPKPSKWDWLEAIGAEPPPNVRREVCRILRARTDWRLQDGRSVLGKKIREAKLEREKNERRAAKDMAALLGMARRGG